MKKRNVIVLVVLVLITSYACDQKKVNALRGEYLVGSFEMQPNNDLDSLKSKGLLNFGEVPFNFLDNDTVIIYQELGDRIFGDAVFKYEQTDTYLILTNNDKRIELPYTDDGVIRIKLNDEYFARLDLAKLNKN